MDDRRRSLGVALIGDSIRLRYQPLVADRLHGVARVWGPGVNCESSRHLRRSLDRWLLEPIAEPTVVHLNAGAHDVRRYGAAGAATQVSLHEYRQNMAAIADSIASAPDVIAVIIATTTPVDERRHEAARHSRRRNADIEAYNDVLVALAAERAWRLNDLAAVIAARPLDFLSDDGLHPSPAGTVALANAVARAVGSVIGT